MSNLELIICPFPILFMCHEFEEIIGFKRWIGKNELWLEKKFPQLAPEISYIEKLSIPAFTIAVIEEFIIISIISVLSLLSLLFSYG